MYIQIIFLSICNAALIYQRTYETSHMQNTVKLENSKQYLIQISIVKFPEEQSCLPFLQVNSTLGDSMEVLYDEEGYSTKSRIQQIYVTADSIQIAVYNKYLTMINYSNQSELITFQLSIFDSPPQEIICQFPSYGVDCQQKIEEIETETTISLIVPQNSWNYIYYILDNYDYVIEAESEWAQFFVALLPIDKAETTRLPSFISKYFLLNGDSKQINLERFVDIESYIFVVGVYNFNSEAEITISLNTQGSNSDTEFPLWAILTIIGVFLLGITISVFIICQLRKQAKVYEEKPKISVETLDKYMPCKPVPKHQLPEQCCICLIQFLKKDQVRETPCKHFFHGNCLKDWTKKNSTCPVCRQELNEEDIKKFLCLSQLTHKNEIDNSNQGELPKIPLTQLRISDHEINTRGIIMVENSPSNQQSHSDRLSINLIEDQIVEN